MKIQVATFYHFCPHPLNPVDQFVASLEHLASQISLRGLMITGPEGVNATISGTKAACEEMIDWIVARLNANGMEVKWSEVDRHPFLKFKVKVRDEIVSLGRPDIIPNPNDRSLHMSPDEWHRTLQQEDVICIDTRNWYETEIGKFKGAIDPRIESFHEFPAFIAQQGYDKGKKILIYCTGGIRCEKAAIELKQQGFENVYQLEGGILNYLAKYPDQLFEGQCFVFDYRVAVDQHLNPSNSLRLCVHCGQPAETQIDCRRCDTSTQICKQCYEQSQSEPWLETCSKNCANHWKLSPGKKGAPQKEVQNRRVSCARAT